MAEHNHIVDKDGDLHTRNVDNALAQVPEATKDRILDDFNTFKAYLGRRIELAETIGLSEEQMAKIATRVADYLAAREEPRNSEEKLLQELWQVGTDEERHMLAHMLVRLAGPDGRRH